jgi:hypothetical protein
MIADFRLRGQLKTHAAEVMPVIVNRSGATDKSFPSMPRGATSASMVWPGRARFRGERLHTAQSVENFFTD